MNKRQLEREIKRLKNVQTTVRDVLRTEKQLAKKRARRWFTPRETLELQLHMHHMWRSMERIKKSLKPVTDQTR